MTEKKVRKGKLKIEGKKGLMKIIFPKPTGITMIAVAGDIAKDIDEVTVTNSKGKIICLKLHERGGMSQASVKAGKVKRITISRKR